MRKLGQRARTVIFKCTEVDGPLSTFYIEVQPLTGDLHCLSELRIAASWALLSSHNCDVRHGCSFLTSEFMLLLVNLV